MISSKVVLIILIILAAVVFEDLLTCLQPDFAICEEHLHGLAAEISLIFLPSLLSLLAVTFVSVFAFKLQLKLAGEIQPTVNLPPPPPEQQAGQPASARVNHPGRNNKDDVRIFDIEDDELEIEEPQPRQPPSQISEERKEAKEADFDVRRLNTDPNSFFKVYSRGKKSPVASSNTCFKPLSVLAERIMMLNIAALILVLVFILTNSIRLYFIVTGEKCDAERSGTIVFVRLSKFLSFFLCVLYAIVIRKKLCK